MFGSIAKETLPKTMNITRDELYVVSIMPCTAKKFEAHRPEFKKEDIADVDVVLTTQELGKMIKQAGVQFNDLMPESLDMPLGFKTGAGVIFGASGGVSEAVLRYASEKLTGVKLESVDFNQVRGNKGILEKTITIGDLKLKLAIVQGLKNARTIAEKVRQGQCDYDFIEVMACPGGCIAGAGQPISLENKTKQQRTNGLYDADKMLQLHKSQDNPYIVKCYKDELGEIGGHKAHELLHTSYQSRKRIVNEGFSLIGMGDDKKLRVSVCVGTSCYLRGSQKLLQKIMNYVREKDLENIVDVRATFCFEKCDNGPNIKVGNTHIGKCNFDMVCAEITEQLKAAV